MLYTMIVNIMRQDTIEDRRRSVAMLRRRRLSIRQIVRALEKEGKVNPEKNTPWTIGTIQKDLDFLRKQARREAMKDTLEHRSEILADYHELLRVAWQGMKYTEVRKILGDIRSMLGTDAPQVIIMEQTLQNMEDGVRRLGIEFANEPEIYERAVKALAGEAYAELMATDFAEDGAGEDYLN